MNRFCKILVIASLIGMLPCSQLAARTANPIHLTVTVSPQPIRSGEAALVAIDVRIDSGWHVYSVVPSAAGSGPSATQIVSAGRWTPLGRTIEDSPVVEYDPNFNLTVRLHQSTALFQRAFRVPAVGARAVIMLPVDIHYQTCNDSICLPPADVVSKVTVHIGSGPARTAYLSAPAAYLLAAAAPVPASIPANVPSAPSSPLAYLLAAIGAGFLAILTPCVFPLIPITLTGFVKQAVGDKGKLRRLSFGFAMGIVALYVLLGALVALTLGAVGVNRVASNPWVNLVEFAIFVVFALSFFEAITLQLPASLSGLQTTARKHGGTAGLVLLGAAFVLASFTCTAPFVGTLLVAAAGGERTRPLLGMLSFALAFASPFIVFGFSPGWIAKIPKSGVWLVRTKGVLGFIELAASLKFLSNADQVWQWKLLTAPVLLGLWAVIFVLAALYVAGILRIGASDVGSVKRISTPAMAGSALFVAAAVYCFLGAFGRPIAPWFAAFLPPDGYGGVGVSTGVPWHPDLGSATAEANATGKPILIDFTGYTCTNCRLNERNIFPREAIQARLKRFALAQLYTDGGKDGPSNQKFELDRFGDVALPLYGVIDSKTGTVIDSIAGVVSPDRFAAFLDHALTTVEADDASVSQPWAPYSPDALHEAQQQGKPAIIDFTADWCVNCKVIEKQDFADPSAATPLSNFVTLRSDMTNWTAPANAALQAKYGILALPSVVIFGRDGKEIKSLRITGRISLSDFLHRLSVAQGATA